VCCTSSNAVAVVEEIAAEFGVDTVLMIPDEFLAKNVAKQTSVKIISWAGHCEVHERFSAEDIRAFRQSHPGAIVLAHPECPPSVIAEADFAGSTSAMIQYVEDKRPPRVVMVTECSMSDNVANHLPDVEFLRPCNLCPHMKRITLGGILRSLQTMTHEVMIDPALGVRAKKAIDRMLRVAFKPAKAA
jgi:quinolinate synthase